MKYCSKCGVYIENDTKRCPLCQNKLTEKEVSEALKHIAGEQQQVFPPVPDSTGIYNLCIKILLLISVIITVATVSVNYFFQGRGWWSLFVLAGLVCVWAAAGIAIRKRKNILKNVLWQMIVISLICVIWDKVTGWRGWSVDFVLPITYLTAMLILVIMNRVLKLQAEDYMIYGLLGSLFGLIPLIFLLLGQLKYRLPSVLCIGASIVFMAVLFIFQGGKMAAELKRRSHW